MGLLSFLRREKDLSCEDVLEVLQSYLDGETSAETARNVSGHLHKCANCEPESELYQRIKDTLHMTAADVDPTVLERLTDFGRRVSSGEIVASGELDG